MIKQRVTKKRIITAAVLLAIVTVILALIWPMSFWDAISIEGEEVQITFTNYSFEETEMHTNAYAYILTQDSEEFIQVRQILDKYSYHHTIKSLYSLLSRRVGQIDGSIDEGWMNFYCGDKHFASGGTGEVSVNGWLYKIGYWGNNKAVDLMEEVRETLKDVEPVSYFSD